MSNDVKLEPETIWLSPGCDECAEGRSWANPAPEAACDDCGLPWVKYVRADLASHQPQREAVLDLDAAAKRFQYEHRNACYPDATEFEAREAAEQIVRAALTTPAPAVKPHCSTCGKDVAEVLCETCGKWWADNPPPAPAVSTDEIVATLERCSKIVDRNLYHQHEKVEDVPRMLRQLASRIRGEGE